MIYTLKYPSEKFRFNDKVKNFLNNKWIVKLDKVSEKRSNLLNNALHLWFQNIAIELNNAGLYYTSKLFNTKVQISWTKHTVKYDIYHVIMYDMFKKTSTADLTNKEACEIIDEIFRVLGEAGLEVPEFPNHFWQHYERS